MIFFEKNSKNSFSQKNHAGEATEHLSWPGRARRKAESAATLHLCMAATCLLRKLRIPPTPISAGRGTGPCREALSSFSDGGARNIMQRKAYLLSTPDLPFTVPLLLRLLLLFCYCRCSTCHRRTSTRSPEQWVPAFSTTWLHRIGRLALGIHGRRRVCVCVLTSCRMASTALPRDNPAESCSHGTANSNSALQNISKLL